MWHCNNSAICEVHGALYDPLGNTTIQFLVEPLVGDIIERETDHLRHLK